MTGEGAASHHTVTGSGGRRCEVFHRGIIVDNFPGVVAVQSDLGGNRAPENALINIAERARQEAAQPADPGRGMGVADDDAGAKDGEAGEADGCVAEYPMAARPLAGARRMCQIVKIRDALLT